jgi:hypothetical protein
MGRVNRMIPESAVRHKSPERRKRVFETYFDLNRKSKRLAFSWWFFFWPLAGHRFYLNQYKAAAIMMILCLPSLVFVMLEGSLGPDKSGTDFHLFSFFPFIIFLIEGLFLMLNVGFANSRIREKLLEEIESVPYAPLS